VLIVDISNSILAYSQSLEDWEVAEADYLVPRVDAILL
jgi:hypothetical protein